MGERSSPQEGHDGIRLIRRVLEALPAQDVKDEAIKATVEGMVRAAELLQEGDIGTLSS